MSSLKSCLLVLACSIACQAQDWKSYPVADAPITFQIPPDGVFAEIGGFKFQFGFLALDAGSGFRSNINVVSEASELALNEYAKRTEESLTGLIRGLKITQSGEFRGSNGLKAFRLVSESTQQNRELTQVAYLFDGGKTKYVLTGSCLRDFANRDLPIFDKVAATFSIRGEEKGSIPIAEAPFTFELPQDGEFADFPGMKYQVGYLKLQDGDDFRANVNAVDEAFAGSLREYGDAIENGLQRIVPEFKKLSAKQIKTKSGAPAFRMVYESRQQGRDLTQVSYVIDGGDVMYILTGTTSRLTTDRDLPVFDTIAQSFRVR